MHAFASSAFERASSHPASYCCSHVTRFPLLLDHAQKPEDYVKKSSDRSVYGGKQFGTAPPKDGRTLDVYFEKKLNWISDVSTSAAGPN